MDITLRLEPIILDIERTREPILIVGKLVALVDVSLHTSPPHFLSFNAFRSSSSQHLSGHQGIHRLLYAYFMGLPREKAPYVSIPLNTVIELTPTAYGCEEKRYLLLSKEEMMNDWSDGQDEPVTSMPMKDQEATENVRKSTEGIRLHADSFDVMNPPSF